MLNSGVGQFGLLVRDLKLVLELGHLFVQSLDFEVLELYLVLELLESRGLILRGLGLNYILVGFLFKIL